MQFIVKVQLPLSSNHADPEALVYNKERTLVQQFPVTKDLRQLMGGQDKRYFHAALNDRQELVLGKPTKQQPW